ncbi:MAG: TlpA disulfide reductase family protein [Oscillospiraceae bacterium]
MNSKKKTILAILTFIVFIALTTVAYNTLSKKSNPQNNIGVTESKGDVSENNSSQPEKVKAPDFTVIDGDGNSVKLSELIGKPIVLNFWASWCPPCKSEMPEFNKVYGDVGEDIIFAMVDMVDGQRETLKKGKKYVTDKEFTFPVYYDTEQDAASTYGVSLLPTTYFIDKDGYIITGAQGPIDEETLLKGIDYIDGE